MKASIITIGDELLIGQTIDTNTAFIGAQLSTLGFDVIRSTSIHDRREDILAALSEAEKTCDVVLITGGLGPTSDDITKPALCEYFNTRLVIDRDVLSLVTSMMAKRNFPMNENNRRQAEVPESCRVLENLTGTAPGMWFEKGKVIFVSMPGVPHEMKYLMTEHVLPVLKKRFTSQAIIHRNIMTYGTPEAKLAELLAPFEEALPPDIKLAYLPSAGIIKLRLTGTGKDNKSITGLVDEQVRKLYSIIPELIYGENEETMEMVVGRLLLERKQTLCTAESCTGGTIAHLITSISGCSAWYRGSVVAYSNDVKSGLLGVDQQLIAKKGAVSEEVARQMAEGARSALNTHWSVATTGIAGPDGGTEAKPVGTVWIAVSSQSGTEAMKFVYGNDRLFNIRRFSIAALNLLRKQIISS